MAEDEGDQAAKDKIKKGMDESGRSQVKGGGEAGKGGVGGHGADPGKLAEGMAPPHFAWIRRRGARGGGAGRSRRGRTSAASGA
jgi:hypothetical protein